MTGPASSAPRRDPWSQIVALSGPERALPRDFTLVPDAEVRAALAAALDLMALRKLRFEGRLLPEGKRDWRLTAKLGATVVQPCSVTLVPVTTRIDAAVTRLYVADLPEPAPGETEMPGDETVESLPETLDLGTVMAEALALELPDFPRAEGVELGSAAFAEPGVAPLTDDAAKPLAGLARLRERLRGDDPGEPD